MKKTIAVLPIKNTVLFPTVTMPLAVGRPRSVASLLKAHSENNQIVIVTQQNLDVVEPELSDLYKVGTLCKIDGVHGSEENGYQIVVTGLSRFQIEDYLFEDGHHRVAGAEIIEPEIVEDPRREALFQALKALSKEILSLIPGMKSSIGQMVEGINDPKYLTHLASTYLNIPIEEKQKILENIDLISRMEKLLEHLRNEREVLNVKKDVQEKITERFSKAQRDAILREQMRAIKEELGDQGGGASEGYREKIEKAKMPKEAYKQAQDELNRFEQLSPHSPDYHVVRNYLDWMLSLPWNIKTTDRIDIVHAENVLNEEHYGLEKIKQRILQHLAVARLKKDLKGSILLFVGPPGVGKTSLGQSIAHALERNFVRLSLGGVRDESEIRGHRRTYIGSMPGRIVQSLKRAGSRNPVMMLDEVDKLGAGFHGDPSSALLEVLDPEQNNTFVDHYLDVPFDLSDVLFIATANRLDTIPAPLLDRMEIIELASYTLSEKVGIAKKYLIPKQYKENGLQNDDLIIPDVILEQIAEGYTREAGVRELQRQIGAIGRWAAEKIVRSEIQTESQKSLDQESSAANPLTEGSPRKGAKVQLDGPSLVEALGSRKYYPDVALESPPYGVVTGIAWTPMGGDVLFVETHQMPGSGKITITGQLGDVMKESAQIAMSLARSQASILNPSIDFEKNDFHIHVPSGAIGKDGPSAGVTLTTALISLLLKKEVNPKLSMTGEITLRRAVLPVGGIKEKVLAAHRAGIEEIILPKRNEVDLEKLPAEVKSGIKFHFAETLDDVLKVALDLPPFSMIQHMQNGLSKHRCD